MVSGSHLVVPGSFGTVGHKEQCLPCDMRQGARGLCRVLGQPHAVNILFFCLAVSGLGCLFNSGVLTRDAICRQLQEPRAVNSFLDFMKARIGNKNVWQWPGTWAESGCLQGYGAGRLHFGNALQEDVIDRIRVFAENCDLLQAGAQPAVLSGTLALRSS